MNDAVDDFISTRWSLVRALKDKGDDESWRHFFDIYWKLIYCAAKKAGCVEVEAQEVVQETVICVARQIEDFRADPGAGSFKGWLLTLTRRRVVDQLRRRKAGRYVPAQDDCGGELAPVLNGSEPVSLQFEEYWQAEWEQTLVAAALDRLRPKVSAKQFQIFDLIAIKEASVAEVSRALDVSPAQVYLARHRVGRLFAREVRELQKTPF